MGTMSTAENFSLRTEVAMAMAEATEGAFCKACLVVVLVVVVEVAEVGSSLRRWAKRASVAQ